MTFQSFSLNGSEHKTGCLLLLSWIKAQPQWKSEDANFFESVLSLPFLTVFTFIKLALAPLRCSVCVAPEKKKKKKRGSGKEIWKNQNHSSRLRSFNSPRGVIQHLNKLGHSTLLISSCFCLSNSPSTLSMMIGNQQISNAIFNITYANIWFIYKSGASFQRNDWFDALVVYCTRTLSVSRFGDTFPILHCN